MISKGKTVPIILNQCLCLIAQEFPFAECPDIPVAQG
jgi:hypothetical protein